MTRISSSDDLFCGVASVFGGVRFFPLALPAVLLGLAWMAPPARALVNPALQPLHLYERYHVVVGLRVESFEIDAMEIHLAVLECFKGKLPVEKVVLSLADERVLAASDSLLWEGATLVAFVGQTGRGREGDFLFYAGAGQWQKGALEQVGDFTRWRWEKDLEQEMFGTFNGSADRLLEMMRDAREGRYYFPAVPVAEFSEAIAVDRLAGPVRGVALYDLSGDGRLDLVAASPAGNRVYLQTAALKFEDATAALGLEGTRSASVSVADVNADGRPDLLLGGVIYLGQVEQGKTVFRRTQRLPAEADRQVKAAAFVEINGDGYPDVVVSRGGGGLAVYLNSGARGGPFVDATVALGLDREQCGAGGDGYFAPGDFDGDGRTDLFYAVGNGLFLMQSDAGRFEPLAHYLEFDFDLGGEGASLPGTAAFAPLLRPDAADLILTNGMGVNLLAKVRGRVQDLTHDGNELQETSYRLMALLAEDLDADGNVDVFVTSREDYPSKLFINRGYGSFMCPNKYKPGVFPPEVADRGTWGIVAGDVTGNGANDLVLGGADGSLTLLVNGVLDARGTKEHPTYHEKKLDEAKLVTVRVAGKLGVLNADVVLADGHGNVVGRRMLGAHVATGCRGPDEVTFVVREPGEGHVLSVRFADGLTHTWPVDLAVPERRLRIDARRP